MRLSGLKILVFCLCLLVAFSASAEELSFSMNGFNSCKQRSATPFNNQYSEFTFDTTSKIFSYEAKFSTEGGMPLPDLLHFIIVPQDQSPAYAGRYIDVFIDAKNINNPIVSGYVFNGIVPTTGVDGRLNNVCNSGFVYSFTDRDPKDAITVADPLFSTLVPATASVVELKNVFDDSLNGNTYRTFELVLNGNLIQKNSANYCKDIFYQNAPTCVFDGLTVKTSPDKAGFFWFASAGGNISYYTEGTNTGYIGSLTGLSHCSACFNQSVATNRSPSCDSISYSNQTGAPGLKTSVAIKLFDKEANPLQVNVQGLPSGASTDPAIGQSLIPNSTNGFGVVNLNWTPRASQAGDYIMTLVATQNYGENKKSATCNMSLKINSLGDFVGSCTAANFSANKNTLEENAFFIKSQGNKLYKLLSSIKGASKREAAILKKLIAPTLKFLLSLLMAL